MNMIFQPVGEDLQADPHSFFMLEFYIVQSFTTAAVVHDIRS